MLKLSFALNYLFCCSAGSLQTVFVEVFILEPGAERVVFPNQLSALASLVVDHVHLIRIPVLIEILLIAVISECFEQSVFAVIEIHLERAVILLIDPDHLFRVA